MGQKNGLRKKEYYISISVLSSSYRHDYVFFNTSIDKSLHILISMLYLHFFNVLDSNTLWIDLLNYHTTGYVEC